MTQTQSTDRPTMAETLLEMTTTTEMRAYFTPEVCARLAELVEDVNPPAWFENLYRPFWEFAESPLEAVTRTYWRDMEETILPLLEIMPKAEGVELQLKINHLVYLAQNAAFMCGLLSGNAGGLLGAYLSAGGPARKSGGASRARPGAQPEAREASKLQRKKAREDRRRAWLWATLAEMPGGGEVGADLARLQAAAGEALNRRARAAEDLAVESEIVRDVVRRMMGKAAAGGEEVSR